MSHSQISGFPQIKPHVVCIKLGLSWVLGCPLLSWGLRKGLLSESFTSCNFKRGTPSHLMNPIITSTDIILGETTISSLTIELEKLLTPLRAAFQRSSWQGFSSCARLLATGVGLQRPIHNLCLSLSLSLKWIKTKSFILVQLGLNNQKIKFQLFFLLKMKQRTVNQTTKQKHRLNIKQSVLTVMDGLVCQGQTIYIEGRELDIPKGPRYPT